MKITFLKPLFAAIIIAYTGTTFAQIQTTPLDNYAIHPFGTAFDFTAKFVAMGESGGTIGPTPTGCDLYGFRSQVRPDLAINMGIHQYFLASGAPAALPIISTNTNRGLGIVEENNLPATFNFGCGNLLATFKQSSSNNTVFTIFGSGVASGGMFMSSDRTLKKNIQPIENALEIVNQLNGYTYEYRREERPDLNLPQDTRYGFITQEVQKVMPTVVRRGTDLQGNPADYQVMEYNAIMPVLAEAIKAQQKTITDLEEENQALEARLARLEAIILKGEAATNQQLQLNSMGDVKLSQNTPNPSSNSTTIDYELPKQMNTADLVVFDLKGQEMDRQAIGSGAGSALVNTTNWPAGVYVYAVVVEGKTLARKKMTVK